jgi:histidine ammonia-lyase
VSPVRLERHDQLDLALYRRIVFDHESVVIAPALLDTAERTRDALIRHLDSGASAYGVNTGLGYLAGRSIEPTDQAAFQRSILAGRAAGTGPPLSEPVVRGAMLLRLTGFLSGHAGVSPALCRFLADRLNDRWFPVVPGGATGAAGEIVPLAHLFGTLVGDGFVHAGDRVVPAGDRSVDAGDRIVPAGDRSVHAGDRIVPAGDRSVHASDRIVRAASALSLPPYELGAKEGIALINGAPLAPALAVPLMLRAEALLEHATLCGALAILLTGATARPYVVRVGELKGDPGQLEVHRRLTDLFGTGARLDDARQAPVSLRVIPQVHGAAADVLEHLRAQLEREVRAVTDSPLYLPPDTGADSRMPAGDRPLSSTPPAGDPTSAGDLPTTNEEPEGLYPTGNFHAQYLVLLLDTASIAFTQVVNLLEKRLHRLLDARFSKLPDQLTPDPGRRSGVVVLHKQVLGITAQARCLAAPASVHMLDGSTGQEDFQTHTLLAAAQLDGVLDALELALAHELVALRQARYLSRGPLPEPLEQALAPVADLVAPVVQDRPLAEDIERCRALVASGRLAGGVASPSIWFSRASV